MTDYFALFDELRRPWLEVEQLKAKFLERSAEVHPDKLRSAAPAEQEAASRRFAELNSAFNCLREPKDRLRHLLELELGSLAIEAREMPPNLADLFMEMARLRREVDGFLVESTRTQSALLRVQMFSRAQEWIDRLRAMLQRLSSLQAKLHQELQTLDARWLSTETDPVQRGVMLERLEHIHQELSFYARWTGQLHETTVQLSA